MTDQLQRFLANARGTAATAKVLSLDDLRASRGEVDSEPADRWSLEAMRGRLVELSARGASATLTAAVGLVLEAQRSSEPVAWIMLETGSFFPPDVAETGVDLAALVVIRAHDPTIAARAAERVLRSGAFGLVVLDLVESTVITRIKRDEISMAHQGRLVSLAQAHDAAVVCITDKPADAASLGSLVSLRAEALRTTRPAGGSSQSVELSVRALKDKRRGPGWTRMLRARGPHGL